MNNHSQCCRGVWHSAALQFFIRIFFLQDGSRTVQCPQRFVVFWMFIQLQEICWPTLGIYSEDYPFLIPIEDSKSDERGKVVGLPSLVLHSPASRCY